MGLAGLARLRQAAYRLLAAALLYPDRARLETVAAVAGALRAEGEALAAFAFFGQWRALLDALEGAAGRVAALGETYVRLFLVNLDRTPCLPYESAYVDAAGAGGGLVAARLSEAYAAAGLSLSQAGGEPADHAAVELEFMSCLCDREARAWEAKRLAEGLEVLRRQVAFLEAHPGRWFPTFSQTVARADGSGFAGSGGFYAAVVEAAAAFVSHDLDLQGALLRGFEAGEAA